jgi:hypothetical protein
MRAYFSILFGDIHAPKESFSGYDKFCVSGCQDDVLYTLSMATSIVLGSPAILARSNVESFLGWHICDDKDKSVVVTVKKCFVHDDSFLVASDNEVEVFAYINLDKKMIDAKMIAPEEIRSEYIDRIISTISEHRRFSR